MKGILVTTVVKPSAEIWEKATQVARDLHLPCVERGSNSLEYLQQQGAKQVLVVGRNRIVWHCAAGEYYFHPNMAKLRILALTRGENDHLVQAMGLKLGDVVLDCTLGMAADALVAAHVVGEQGRVIGVEANAIQAYLVADGLQNMPENLPELNAAAQRIEVRSGHHLEILRQMADKSVDVVYFDPMFRYQKQGYEQNIALDFFRSQAEMAPVSMEAMEIAQRVARKRVVLKERQGSQEFQRLGFSQLVGGKYSAVAYGILDVAD